MNEKQADAMLKSLKRMEQLLEAIDWKLWNFHQKMIGDTENSVERVDDETEQLAGIVEKDSSVNTATTVKPAAEKKTSFPSIEKWS
jgi:hypothetical protein